MSASRDLCEDFLSLFIMDIFKGRKWCLIYSSPGYDDCQLKTGSSATPLLVPFSNGLFKSKSQTHNHFTYKYFSMSL